MVFLSSLSMMGSTLMGGLMLISSAIARAMSAGKDLVAVYRDFTITFTLDGLKFFQTN